jgi:hypothetical protein
MLVLRFDCPHCAAPLECPARWEGQTHPCPDCGNLIHLRVMDTQEAIRVGMAAGRLAALKNLFFGGRT